jgi:hypothetical protein
MNRTVGAFDSKSGVLSSLQDFQAWKAANLDHPFSFVDYARCVCEPDKLLAASTILYPTLVVHDGLHFREDSFDLDGYSQWLEKLESREQAQEMMNHLDVRSLFSEAELTDDVCLAVASTIAKTWEAVFSGIGLKAPVLGSTWDDLAVTLVEG